MTVPGVGPGAVNTLGFGAKRHGPAGALAGIMSAVRFPSLLRVRWNEKSWWLSPSRAPKSQSRHPAGSFM
jgi:hypothetical protein